ncbi:MAG: flippase-like domain-containing protein [Armatimonadota bacterium]|nr:flippase-like domain-containing protein [Armatimonadota bacterium]
MSDIPPVTVKNVVENAASDDTRPNRAARWKWFARLALGLLILALMLRRGDASQVQRALQTVSPLVLAASVLFYWLAQMLSATKWRLLLQARGAPLAFSECCRLYLLGMFWNLWMPTNIGGDAMRAYAAAPRSGGVAAAASSILVERLTGFIALLTIGMIGLTLHATSDLQRTRELHLLLRVIGVLAVFAILAVVSRAVALRLEVRRPHSGLLRKWANLHRALDFYASHRRWPALAGALGLSFLFQSAQVVHNLVLAHVVGLDLPGSVFWWLVPLLAVASLLPLGLGGLGVREAAAVAMLAGTGVAPEIIVAWSLLWQATIWLASLPGALFVQARKSGTNDYPVSGGATSDDAASKATRS